MTRQSDIPALIESAIRRLDAIDDPLARKVLDLHGRKTLYPRDAVWMCEGCDPGEHAQGPPDWPCQTVALIGEHFGIDLTFAVLYARPVDGSLDA